MWLMPEPPAAGTTKVATCFVTTLLSPLTGVCVLYLDFLSDLLRLITYASFFTIVCYHYGLPLRTWHRAL